MAVQIRAGCAKYSKDAAEYQRTLDSWRATFPKRWVFNRPVEDAWVVELENEDELRQLQEMAREARPAQAPYDAQCENNRLAVEGGRVYLPVMGLGDFKYRVQGLVQLAVRSHRPTLTAEQLAAGYLNPSPGMLLGRIIDPL